MHGNILFLYSMFNLYFAVGGFGLGAFIFNQIQTAYLNPLNHKLDDGTYFTDEKILNRVPSLFLLLGSIYAVIQVPSSDG